MTRNPPPIPGRTLLFDLDGTLVDTVPDIAAAANRTMKAMGHPERSLSELRSWIGNGSVKLIKRSLTGEWDGEPDETLLKRALTHFFDDYAEHLWEESRLYADVEETLAGFQREGMRLGCVTNKPKRHTRLLLEASGLSRHLSAWVGGDTLPVRKPDPGPLLHAATLLGSTVHECVMIGDSMNDIMAARAADMPVICLSYGYNQGMDLRSGNPDRLIDQFHELPHHLTPVLTDESPRRISSG